MASKEANTNAKVIGKVVMPEQGTKMHTVNGMKEVPQFHRDELARFLNSRSYMKKRRKPEKKWGNNQ